MTSSPPLTRRSPRSIAALGIAASMCFSSLPAVGQTCGGIRDALPVPQNRPIMPANSSLWPTDAFGNVLFRPVRDTQLPANRDSTSYITQTIPGQLSGHELFMDLATLDNNDDWIFVAYNAGIQTWDLRNNPKEPSRTRYRDGWEGHFFEFPHAGEVDTYVEAIDAVESNGDILLGVVGRNGHGFSLWEFTPPSTLVQHCQFSTLWARQVEMIQHTDGKAYAIVSASTGVHVFDATASTGAGQSCVYKGKVGDMVDGDYVSVLQKDGRVYVAASDGRSLPADPLALEIWRLDPANPGTLPLGGSRKLFSGFNTNTRGPVLFQVPGPSPGYFLGLIELGKLKFYDIESCLGAATTSCSLGNPLAQVTLSPATGSFQFVDVSTSADGRTWAYYGLETTFLLGGKVELLLDVTPLNSVPSGGSTTLSEITDGGDTYFNTNVCSNTSLAVDYWGDYYTNNLYGRNFVIPRHGVFINNLFYRAAYSMFDIHEIVAPGGGTSQHITTTVDGDPIWLGDNGSFAGSASGDCTPGNGNWCWTVMTEGVGGDVFTPSVVSGTCSDISPKDVSFSCVPGVGKDRCSEGAAIVEAWNTSCGTYPPPAAEVTAVQVSLKDPTVGVEGVIDTNGSTTYQQCQEVPLRATVGGRGPVTWQWLVDGEALPGCDGSAGSGADISTAVVACAWDTSGVQLEDIFADGFESGDVSLWSTSLGTIETMVSRQIPRASYRIDLTKAASRDLSVELVVSNGAELDREAVTVTIETIGEPTFTSAIGTSVIGNAATLTAPAADTSTWTWEIEDPNPQPGDSSAACSFKPAASCTTVTTGTADSGDTVQHAWIADGTYEFKVSLSNCISGSTPPSAMGSVTVSGAVEPIISSFKIQAGEASCCGVPNIEFKCVAGVPISMQVVMAEESGSYAFGFDWERTSTASATYSTQSPIGSSGSTYNFEHTFSSTPSSRTVYPIVEVTSGLSSDTRTYFTSGGSVTILPAGSACQ